jgi:adenine-specific DNA-methyltransferase
MRSKATARRKTYQAKEIAVESYSHKGKKRKNNPHVGLVSTATDKLNGRTLYKHDPHIDPYLSWAGKAEGMAFEVQNVSLHIHERIDPKRIIKAFLKKKEPRERQLELFGQPDNDPPLNKAIDFYRHEQDWTNRLIAGDSLLVMNSLLKKEGMAGKVQMIYVDPPYGIKYNSNFQPFVNKRDVKDGNDADLPAEPEMIQSFRDTWQLGIHSYLTHLRDRLLLVKDLLHESGSCFVQISDENVHHVREILDEVFGASNFCSIISFQKTGSLSGNLLGRTVDYLVWYAREKSKVKYRQLFLPRSQGDPSLDRYDCLELPDGSTRRLTQAEVVGEQQIPDGKRYRLQSLFSKGETKEGSFAYNWHRQVYECQKGSHWKTTKQGLDELAKRNRLGVEGTRLRYRRYLNDFPVIPLADRWESMQIGTELTYVVQTAPIVVQRCLLMTTDPGDLVLDPTCGSGTTAYVAEQWGRRWITCDTSRVAITLAKQRLMTAKFDYFELAHPAEGIRSGFKHKTVPHIMLSSIANNEPPREETLYDQPMVEKNKVRVTGPFTVEAVPCLRIRPFDGSEPRIESAGAQLSRAGETSRQAEWRDELKTTGIRAVGGKALAFSRIEPMVATRFLHAEGEILEPNGTTRRAYISFGPDFGPLEQRQVEEALKEARALKPAPDFVIFAAFHFDPEAAKDVDLINWPGTKILKAQMSVDLLTKDLRKSRSSSHSYWLIGQPDVEVKKQKDDTYRIKVNGFDYYDPISGEIISKGTKHIAMWFLDTDYDERSLYPDQVFFPEGDSKRDWTRLAKALNGEVNEELLGQFAAVESLPFSAGESRRVAVKIIDNRGIESFVIRKLDQR